MSAISCHNLSCTRPEWTYGPSRVDNISLDLEAGQLHAIRGEPRSGKTLLLHLLGLLEPSDAGTIRLFGEPVTSRAPAETGDIRNAVFGYLFPSPCLLPAFTVAENVAMPLFRFTNPNPTTARHRVTEILTELGIDDLATELADTLPTADQHLVALARAIIHRPRILIAINPGPPESIHPYLTHCVTALGLTCLWSGGPLDPALQCDRQITLHRGHVVAESSPWP